MARNPYLRRWDQYLDNVGPRRSIKDDFGTPIYVTRDGKIQAKGFIDTNDDKEFFMEDGSIKVRQVQDAATNLSKDIVLNHTDAFIAYSDIVDSFYESFGTFQDPVQMYETLSPPEPHKKYELLSKKTKADVLGAINESLNKPRSFNFHFTGNDGIYHVDPYVKDTWFGPYNFDVYIEPQNLVDNISDVLVVKSGELNKISEDPAYGVHNVMFSTGLSGHIYLSTISLPSYTYTDFSNYPIEPGNDPKFFKFPRSGNSNFVEAVTSSGVMPLVSGGDPEPIGVFKNGVFLFPPADGTSFSGSGVWNSNSVVSQAESFNLCGGTVVSEVPDDSASTAIYSYKTVPYCIYDRSNTTEHSPLLGFALDGFPIYGPYGYSNKDDVSSSIKRLETSYKLKQASSRAEGPDFTGEFPSGYFLEDYEYVYNLGDLDAHNGRSGITPEYPDGTYAYFATVNILSEAEYPYAVGPTFYGEISDELGYGQGIEFGITEPVTLKALGREGYPVDVGLWEIYGDTYHTFNGLKHEKIIWVSPHITKVGEGVFLKTGYEQALTNTGIWDYDLHTGSGMATFNGNRRMATGNGDFMTFVTGFSYPTSQECHLHDSHPISGAMQFLYTDSDTSTSIVVDSPSGVVNTEFYEMYSGHRRVANKVSDVYWNGIIPKGTPFKIEEWAFNGFEMGFDGKFQFTPVEEDLAFTSGNMMQVFGFGTGYAETAEEAHSEAFEDARRQMVKNLETVLVLSGVKRKNARMRAWEKLKGEVL